MSPEFESLYESIKNIEECLNVEHFIDPVVRSINQYNSSAINHKLSFEFGKFMSTYQPHMTEKEREATIIISLLFHSQNVITNEVEDIIESLIFMIKSRFAVVERVKA